MTVWKIPICSALVMLSIVGCYTPEKLSKRYYRMHKSELDAINNTYNALYQQQPFILNFTQSRFRKYSIEVTTDSIRYIYNTSIMNFSVLDSIGRFGLDSPGIKKLKSIMIKAKCNSVARHFFYYNEQKYSANYLYFKQSKSGMFSEKKYHVLLFFQYGLTDEVRNELVSRRNLIRMEKNIFYTISERFK